MVRSEVPAPLRVCHVIHSLAPGGAEELLVELAAGGPSVGIETSFLSLMPLAGYRVASDLAALGVAVGSLDLPSRYDGRALTKGVQALRRLRPEVIHTHLKHADVVGGFAAWRLGVKQVSTLHVIEDDVSGGPRFKRWVGAQARSRFAARTIAVSDAQRDWYLRTFAVDGTEVVTVHNGLAPPLSLPDAQRAALRGALGLGAGDVAATMLGVMRAGKGHEQLIEAARRIPTGSPVRFLLAGDGPLRHQLEAHAAAAGLLGDRMRFLGWRSDVAQLLAASDLIVHPTFFDALPTALIHGLAAGIPAVASDTGGVAEILTPGTGMLVPAGDSVALAAAVSALTVDPARRAAMGRAARRRFDAEFSAGIWLARLRRVYDDALEA